MKKQQTKKVEWLILAALLASGLYIPTVQADCARAAADDLVERSLSQPLEQQRATLKEALRLCSDHAEALNNLGLLEEDAGNLEQAEALYRSAIRADPTYSAAYAGVADVLMANQRYAEAAEAYQRFLDRLQQSKRRGADEWLWGHESDYKAKRDLAREKAGIAPVVIAAAEITDSLAVSNSKTRGIGARYKNKASINLPIQFDYNSATINARSRSQMEQLSQALNSSALKNSRILIEGHTDNQGSADYNRELSERRAAAVRKMLVQNYGLPAQRFKTQGFGESRPVASNETETGRSQNRRVTFTNLGVGN